MVGITIDDGIYAGVYEHYVDSATESDTYDIYYYWKQISTSQSGVVVDSSTLKYIADIDIVSKAVGVNYWLDINGMLDGTASGDLANYGTVDVYMDGNKVATGVNDFYSGNGYYPYGTKYEIKNIQAGSDKKYVGVDTGSLSGNLTEDTIVVLSFKTKTWKDYAAGSFAGGSGTIESPFIIKTPEQLALLSYLSHNNTLSGLYYKLGANIDLSAHIWDGIGNEVYPFASNFDGDYYCISHVNMNSKIGSRGAGLGLFNYVHSPAVIQNLIIRSGTINDAATDSRDVGMIVGGNDTASMIRNCIVEDVTVKGIKGNASGGGIVGRFTGGTITSCLVKNSAILSDGTAAGICGWRGIVQDCLVISSTIQSGWQIDQTKIGVGWWENTEIKSSYAYYTGKSSNTSNTLVKIMYGSSNDWGNWSYSPLLNGGYPVQKTLFAIGGLTGSQNVYNYLTSTLKFSVA